MQEKQIPFYNDWRLLLIGCLTLGLTPYFPEPHLLGKLRWVAGGAIGMQPMDWWDLVMHGTPWLFMVVFLVRKFILRTI